jgi:pyridoxamine 5'-phosphate oxidase
MHELRRNYEVDRLLRQDLASDPFVQFQKWFRELQSMELPEWFEMNAMTLSSADCDGRVTSRIVLLKAVSESAFTFFTNYLSLKASQLSQNPQASLNFYWAPAERQVRVEGHVERTSPEVSDEYFSSRPFRSRLAAVVSPQSEVIPDDRNLESEVEKLSSDSTDEIVKRPENWGGLILYPSRIEFWQGRPSRLHDRYEYFLRNGLWEIRRLGP